MLQTHEKQIFKFYVTPNTKYLNAVLTIIIVDIEASAFKFIYY